MEHAGTWSPLSPRQKQILANYGITMDDVKQVGRRFWGCLSGAWRFQEAFVLFRLPV